MIDYSAFDKTHSFTAAVKRGAKEAWINIGWGLPKNLAIFFIVVSVGFFFIPVFLLFFVAFLTGGELSVAVMFLIIALFASGIVVGSLYFQGKGILQLEEFCSANNFEFHARLNTSNEKGVLFTKGNARIGSNAISGRVNQKPFWLFNYSYTTGSGKNKTKHVFTVAKIGLARRFPHILLDNKRDGSVGSLEFDRSQHLELEGDFNKFFNVFGPKEYEIEVLQILNPKVMQALLSIGEPFDIEILGNELYVYDKGTKRNQQKFESLFEALSQIETSTKSVQKSFSMPAQIGDYKPILKKSKWPVMITIGVFLLYVAFQIFIGLL